MTATPIAAPPTTSSGQCTRRIIRENPTSRMRNRETVEGVLHPPPDDALEEIARHQIERGGRRCVAARKPEAHAARSAPPDADLAEAFEQGDGEHHDYPDPPATHDMSRQQHDKEDRERQQHAHPA